MRFRNSLNMASRLMQLKALEKSRKRPQGLLDVEERKWVVAWIIASQPPLTPTPSWRGVRVELTILREEYDRHLGVSRQWARARARRWDGGLRFSFGKQVGWPHKGGGEQMCGRDLMQGG